MGGLSPASVTTGMVAVLAVTMFVALAGRLWMTGRGGASAQELSLYQVAMLAGGRRRVSDTALSYLTWAGMLEAREMSDRLVRVVGVETIPDLHPVELAVLGAVDPTGVRPEVAIGAGKIAAARHVSGLEGLVVDRARSRLVDLAVMIGCGSVAGSGLFWLTAREAATSGFVPLGVLLAVLFSGWWLFSGRPRRTRSGDRMVETLRRRYDGDLEIAAIGVTSLPLERAMHIIALYGRDALTGGLSGLRKVMTGNPSPAPVRSSLGA